MRKQNRKKRRVKISDLPSDTPPLSEEIKLKAKYVAMVVRNAMEDFHSEHLSDKQMKDLNPIIRNAIAKALYALEHAGDNPLAKAHIIQQLRMIPNYWEDPELEDEFSRDGFINDLRELYEHSGEILSEAEFEERAEAILNMYLGADQ
jgi:hypothetical protein